MIVVPAGAAALAMLALSSAIAIAFIMTYSLSTYNKSFSAMQHTDKVASLISVGAFGSPIAQWRVFLEAAVLILFWNMLGGSIVLASHCGAQLWSKLKNVERVVKLGSLEFSFFPRLLSVSALAGLVAALYSQISSLLSLKTCTRKAKEAGDKASFAYITDADFEDLKRRLDLNENEWNKLSEKHSPQLASFSWQKSNKVDPLSGTTSHGLQLLVRTVFEDVNFSDVNEFWLDDHFRSHWDRCFVSSEPVVASKCDYKASDHSCEELMRWVRKFPAFCSAREYIIARKSIFDESSNTAYVVTKAVDIDIPSKIRRVSEYHSSWRIKLVPSNHDSEKYAVETTLLHYEDLGVPNSILKLAVRTFFGWFVSGLEAHGLRDYVKRKSKDNISTNKNVAPRLRGKGPKKFFGMITGVAISLALKRCNSRKA